MAEQMNLTHSTHLLISFCRSAEVLNFPGRQRNLPVQAAIWAVQEMVHHTWHQIAGLILRLVRSQHSLPGLREIKHALLQGVALSDANACRKYWQFCWQESRWLHNWISRLCNARVQQTEEFTLPPRWIYPDRRDSASCYAMDSLNHPAFGSCKLFHRGKSLGFGLSYCIHGNALRHSNFNFALVWLWGTVWPGLSHLCWIGHLKH